MKLAAWLLLAEVSLLILLWLSLRWVILPHIEQWRPLIETQLSQALGVQVRIGSVELRSNDWVPAIEVRNVLLLDSQLRPALRLPRVYAAVSVRSTLASLATLDLRLEQLLIEDAQLEMGRDASGRFFVAGLDFSAPSGGDEPGAADWFFKQYEFAIRGGTLRWTDELRATPPLALTEVDITVRNGLRHHDIRIDATPSIDWGERFELRGRFTQPLLARSGDWQRWSGQVHANLPRADVGLLRQHFTLPFELNEGVGALRAWVGLRDGKPSDLTLDLALRAVAMRLADKVEPLVVEHVQGRFIGQRHGRGGSVSLQQFEFLTGDGLRWPAGDMHLTWTQAPGGTINGGKLGADRLDLDLMARTATRLPLGDALRQVLSELKPRGIVNDLTARWEGPIDTPEHYRVSAKLTGFALAAKPSKQEHGIGRPGLRGAQFTVNATEEGGQAVLAITDGALEFPGVFAEALIPIDRLSSKVLWNLEPRVGESPQIEVRLKDTRFSNADAHAELSATWRTGPGEGVARAGRFPGLLQLEATLRQGVAARTARYLPVGLSVGIRNYVTRAVQSGRISNATFRVNGDLWDLPFFDSKEGDFRVALLAEDVTLAYVPSVPASGAEAAYVSPWPALNRVSGELVIDRSSLEIHDMQAQLYGVELSEIEGGIASLAQQSVLRLEGQGLGSVSEMLRFVNTTPVDTWTGRWLRQTSATGSARLRLALEIPLYDLAQSTVSGALQLADNDVRMSPELPLLAAARGDVQFSPGRVRIVDGSAHVLGGPTKLSGGSQPDGSLRFSARGEITAEGLRRAPELGLLSRLASSLSGKTNYGLTFGLVRGLSELGVTSDLVGMAADLPAPLRKTR